MTRTELVPRGGTVAGFSPFTLLIIHNWLAPFRDLLTRFLGASWSYVILDVILIFPAIVGTCLSRRALSLYGGLMVVLIVNLLVVSFLSVASIDAGPLPLERIIFTIRFHGFYPFLIVVGACLAHDEEKLTQFFEAFLWTGAIALALGILQFAAYTFFGYEIMERVYNPDQVYDMSQAGTTFEYDWVVYRVSSVFNSASQYSWFCFVYFVVCFCAFVRNGEAKYKYGCWLAFPALITSGSRTMFLVAGVCVLLYFNMRRRLIYAFPAVLLFTIYVAPHFANAILGLVDDNRGFIGLTLLDAIDMSEPVSFRAGMDTTFVGALGQSLAIESSVGRVIVELGFLYAIPWLLAEFAVALYGLFAILDGFRHRTSNNLWRLAIATYVVIILILGLKGPSLENYPQSPYLFIIVGILIGSRRSPEKVSVPREVRPLPRSA